MKLSLAINAISGRAHASFLRRHLRCAHAILKPELVEMSLALVGDTLMSDLHQQFMGIAGPTDVLTFPLEVDSRGRVSSGEVVVCVPEARRRARESGATLREELLLYALHGMLHLCGFDDRNAADFEKMHRKEDQILKLLGFGAVFYRCDEETPRLAGKALPKTARVKSRLQRRRGK